MSYPINTKINPYQQQQLQQQPQMGVNTPQLQNVNADSIKQGVNTTVENSNNLVTQAAEKENPALLWGLTLPLWFGISKAMEKFNKACATRTDGKANLLDKVRDFGDKVGGKFEGEKFKKIADFMSRAKEFVKTKIIAQSKILDAMFNNPAKPKFSMARMMSIGTPAEAANDGTQALSAYVKNTDGSYNQQKLNKLGLTAEKLEKMCTDDYKYTDDIIKACKRMAPDEFVELATSNNPSPALFMKKFFRDKVFGRFGQKGIDVYTKIFGRRIYFSEIDNKLNVLKGAKGAPGKTALGRMLPKAFLRTMEGLTNGTAGGKLAIAMQAYFWADAIIASAKAKKGDKGKTFVESFINNVSYYLLMPLGIGIMYGLGGLKYIGMSKEQVEAFRTKLNDFNGRTFASKEEYKTAKNELKTILKGETKLAPKVEGAGKTAWKSIKNVLYKPLKAAGRVITVGLEPIKPYLPKGNQTSTLERLGREMGFNLKRGIGFPLRFIGYMMVIAPPLVNLTVKAGHLIFGRPSKSILDKEEEPKEPTKPLIIPQQISQSQQPVQTSSSTIMQPVQQNVQAQYQQTEAPVTPQTSYVDYGPNQNLVDMYKQASEKNIISNPQEPVRRYIPNDEAVKIDASYQNNQDDKVSSAMSKADKAEQLANKYMGH